MNIFLQKGTAPSINAYRKCKSQLRISASNGCNINGNTDGWISNLLTARYAYINLGGYVHEVIVCSEFSMILQCKEQLEVRRSKYK